MVVLENRCKTFRKCSLMDVDEDGTLHLKHDTGSFKSSDEGVMLIIDGVVNNEYVIETPGTSRGKPVQLFKYACPLSYPPRR